RHIQALQYVAANGPPSDDPSVQLGDPYFQLAQLLLHSGGRELHSPPQRFGLGHRWWREFQDRPSSNVVETARVLVRRSTVNGTHRRLPRMLFVERHAIITRRLDFYTFRAN